MYGAYPEHMIPRAPQAQSAAHYPGNSHQAFHEVVETCIGQWNMETWSKSISTSQTTAGVDVTKSARESEFHAVQDFMPSAVAMRSNSIAGTRENSGLRVRCLEAHATTPIIGCDMSLAPTTQTASANVVEAATLDSMTSLTCRISSSPRAALPSSRTEVSINHETQKAMQATPPAESGNGHMSINSGRDTSTVSLQQGMPKTGSATYAAYPGGLVTGEPQAHALLQDMIHKAPQAQSVADCKPAPGNGHQALHQVMEIGIQQESVEMWSTSISTSQTMAGVDVARSARESEFHAVQDFMPSGVAAMPTSWNASPLTSTTLAFASPMCDAHPEGMPTTGKQEAMPRFPPRRRHLPGGGAVLGDPGKEVPTKNLVTYGASKEINEFWKPAD